MGLIVIDKNSKFIEIKTNIIIIRGIQQCKRKA